MRAPVWMFRIGLGILFGGRLFLLEHTGRSSGKPRYAVLETVSRPATNVVLVASGLGASAQWLQNVRSNPQCFVSIGGIRRAPAVAEVLDRGAAATALADYARKRPWVWKQLHSLVAELAGTSNPEIPIVRLTLAP